MSRRSPPGSSACRNGTSTARQASTHPRPRPGSRLGRQRGPPRRGWRHAAAAAATLLIGGRLGDSRSPCGQWARCVAWSTTWSCRRRRGSIAARRPSVVCRLRYRRDNSMVRPVAVPTAGQADGPRRDPVDPWMRRGCVVWCTTGRFQREAMPGGRGPARGEAAFSPKSRSAPPRLAPSRPQPNTLPPWASMGIGRTGRVAGTDTNPRNLHASAMNDPHPLSGTGCP